MDLKNRKMPQKTGFLSSAESLRNISVMLELQLLGPGPRTAEDECPASQPWTDTASGDHGWRRS